MGKDCYNEETKGTDYGGTKAVAASGKSCTKWAEGYYAETFSTDSETYWEWFYRSELSDTYGVEYDESYCRNPNPEDVAEPWCYVLKDPDDPDSYVTVREVCGIDACSDEDEDDTKDDTDGETGEETEVQEKYSSVSPRRPLLLLVALTLIVFISF